MSGWNAYITNLINTGFVDHAIITGHDGNTWAKSSDFNPSQNEIKLLIAWLQKPTNEKTTDGIKLCNRHYVPIKYSNKTGIFKCEYQISFTAKLTNQTCIIGVANENTIPQRCWRCPRSVLVVPRGGGALPHGLRGDGGPWLSPRRTRPRRQRHPRRPPRRPEPSAETTSGGGSRAPTRRPRSRRLPMVTVVRP
ncbi:profilin [Anaeramoeba flamelloides]|uniref:Profilin n=1 Tax=Anaeramoeba flamelloides TaxID=1746091 RepID=A0ABQ8Z328_9EUKA|nr:profilin [Anaeramoeba flamelloides]